MKRKVTEFADNAKLLKISVKSPGSELSGKFFQGRFFFPSIDHED